MSRIPRKNISTPFLHIMIQGNNKNFIFEDNKDKEKYLKILKEIIERYLHYYKISMEELKNNKELLIKIVKCLKEKYKISYRISSHILDIGREKLRVLIK